MSLDFLPPFILRTTLSVPLERKKIRDFGICHIREYVFWDYVTIGIMSLVIMSFGAMLLRFISFFIVDFTQKGQRKALRAK